MTQFPDLFAALAAPFPEGVVRERTQAGRVMHYITARAAMNRLDSVLGPENWWDEYVPGENSVLCRLTVRLPDDQLLTKADAGGYAGMADAGDDDKSGFSDAFKRAAVKFGVGRYLYRDGVPSFAGEPEPTLSPQIAPRTVQDPPRKERGKWGNAGTSSPATSPARRPVDGLPYKGGQLFGWLKDKDKSGGLLKHIDEWARLQGWPRLMKEWEPVQVRAAVEEARRKLAGGRSEGEGLAS